MVGGIPKLARALAAAIIVVTVVYMLAPLLVVVGASFSAGGYLVFPPQGFSLRWYAVILESESYLEAGLLSLRVALLVTLLSVLLGTPAAIALTRFRFPGRELLQGLFLSPLIIPTIIFGIGMLIMFSRYADGPSIYALVLGHMVITIPYVVRTVSAVLVGVDPATEEAARVMGAGPLQRYLYVLLPQCATGIAAGAFFAFNISFDDAVVAIFLRGPETETLPIKIYTELEFTTDPSVAAVSTLLILLTVAMIVAIERLIGIGLLVRRRVER
jgi:putative spermidine/putrescine transport system permease protein